MLCVFNENMARADSLANSLCDRDMKSFWKEVNMVKELNNRKIPNVKIT